MVEPAPLGGIPSLAAETVINGVVMHNLQAQLALQET